MNEEEDGIRRGSSRSIPYSAVSESSPCEEIPALKSLEPEARVLNNPRRGDVARIELGLEPLEPPRIEAEVHEPASPANPGLPGGILQRMPGSSSAWRDYP